MKPEIVILLGPVGVGKSTRITKLRSAGMHFSHISTDDVIARSARQLGLDVRKARGDDSARIIETAKKSYYQTLDHELATREPKIIVDVASIGLSDLVASTIERGRAAGRKVTVEGIHVEPEAGLERTFARNTFGMEPDVAQKLTVDKEFLSGLLKSFQRFPQQFQAAANVADEATLFDNRAGFSAAAKVIAQWDGSRTPKVLDAPAFESFQRLAQIDPQNPKSSVVLKWSEPQGDDWTHGFGLVPAKVMPVQPSPEPVRPSPIGFGKAFFPVLVGPAN